MRIDVGSARRWVTDLLLRSGMASGPAGRTATAIVLAECWGITSHGLLRVPSYLRRLEAGGYDPDARLTTVRDTGPVVVLDGHGGLGHWQVWEAAETAAERAARFGLAAVAVSDSGHCGALGVATLPALDRGLLAVVLSHGPAAMPAWEGDRPVVSTSPIAVGVPCRPRPAIVDLSTSAVARGTVAEHASRDEPLADGWAFAADGTPTTDPHQALAGMLAPLGGAKGFALAFAVEALTAGLVGPRLSADVPDPFDPARAGEPQQVGHLLLTLDPAQLAGDGEAAVQRRLDELAARTTASGGRVPGAGRRLPHEIADDDELIVATTTWDALQASAGHLGVSAGVGGT
ncbi:Ldh family oxidoreductase [Nocardioides sp.]|uniref:Ldh family oxidoreductase n=1 Tax=Nocardioides sp. TaxID=35761 RepID=UPI002ED63F51